MSSDYAIKAGTKKGPELNEFEDGLRFVVATSIPEADITAGNFTVVTTADLSTGGWPATIQFFVNDRMYEGTRSGTSIINCNGPYGDLAETSITAGEIGYNAAGAAYGNLLLNVANAGLVYQSAAQAASLNVTIAPFLWKLGTTFISYAGGTLALTNTATNYVYAWNNAGTITIEASTTSFAAGVAARGVIIELATVTCAGGATTVHVDNRLALAAASGAFPNLPVTSVADTNFVILTTSVIVQYASLSADRTATLPAANSVSAGKIVVIKDASGSATSAIRILITRSGSDTIDGATAQVPISIPYGSRAYYSDGTSGWWSFTPNGFWSRSGTTLSPAVANDKISVTNAGSTTAAVTGLNTSANGEGLRGAVDNGASAVGVVGAASGTARYGGSFSSINGTNGIGVRGHSGDAGGVGVQAVNDAVGGGLALTVSGGFLLPYRAVTASGNITPGDYTVVGNLDGAAGNVTLTLPAVAATNAGQVFYIHNSDYDGSSGFTLSVDGNGTDTINGDTTAVDVPGGRSLGVQSDGGTNWIVLGAV